MKYEEGYINSITDGLNGAVCNISGKLVELSDFMENLIRLTKNIQNSGRIFFIGNGASAAFCNHMALDWSKNGRVLAHSLSDSAMLTALSNDFSYEDAFVEFLKINTCGKKDTVVTVSSSGNSPNVVKVLEYCKENEITTIGFSGLKSNNNTIHLAKYSLYVPVKTYGMAECIHQVFLHLWLDKFMDIFEWDRDDVQNMNVEDFKL